MAMFESLPGLGGIGESLGGIFDFGGREDQADQMQTMEEQGGDDDGPGIGEGIAQRLFHSQVSEWFEGTEIFDYDLVEVGPKKGGGWVPNVNLTPTGKKWGLILLAAGALFFLTRGGKRAGRR